MLQLRLWEVPRVDLLAKIKAELAAGVEVHYHFKGEPIVSAYKAYVATP